MSGECRAVIQDVLVAPQNGNPLSVAVDNQMWIGSGSTVRCLHRRSCRMVAV